MNVLKLKITEICLRAAVIDLPIAGESTVAFGSRYIATTIVVSILMHRSTARITGHLWTDVES